MKKMVCAVAFCAGTLSNIYANPYQTEFSIEYLDVDGELDFSDTSGDVSGYQASYYFGKVQTDGPLLEAAFLDKASSVNASYISGETDTDTREMDLEYKQNTELDGYVFSGHWVDKQSGWSLMAGYSSTESSSSSSSKYLDGTQFTSDGPWVDSTQWSVGVGKYITDNTTVTLSYELTDLEIAYYVLSDKQHDEQEHTAITLAVKHLAPLSGNMYHGIDVELSRADMERADDPYIWDAAYTFYPQKNYGVSVGYETVTSSDDSDERTFSVGAHWFPTNTFAVQLSYEDVKDDKLYQEKDHLIVAASLRF